MSAEASSPKFFSTSKFVHAMDQFAKENKLLVKLNKDQRINFIHVWYRGSECFEGRYDDIQIKNPIYMRIHLTGNKDIFLNQEQIFKLFECKPVLCIKQNMYRSVPKGDERKNLYLAFIDCVEHETRDGFTYYPVELYVEKSKSRIATVEKQFEKDHDENNDESDSATV